MTNYPNGARTGRHGQHAETLGVEREGEFYNVGFRDADEFDEIRTPTWANEAARDVMAGSRVRTGRRATGGE